MMETFLVLGLCVVLYEALDLLQSCFPTAGADKDGHGCAASDSEPSTENVRARAPHRRKQHQQRRPATTAAASATILDPVSEGEDDNDDDVDAVNVALSSDEDDADTMTDSAEIVLINGRRAAGPADSVFAISGASVS